MKMINTIKKMEFTDFITLGRNRILSGALGLFLSFIVIQNALSQNTQSQGVVQEKPTIMVIPSDIWCIRNGYYDEVLIGDKMEKSMDYKKAFQNNSEIRSFIAALSDYLASLDYPMKLLENQMKSIETDEAYLSLIESKNTGAPVQETAQDILNRRALPDIIFDLDFDKKEEMDLLTVSFTMNVIDAYTNNAIAGYAFDTEKSSGPITTKLTKAVNNFKDNFRNKLNLYLKDIKSNGRKVNIELRIFDGSPVDFETEFEYNGQIAELSDIIYLWFEENTIEGRFNEKSRTATSMVFEEVRMPHSTVSLSGKLRAMRISNYVGGLMNMLRKYDIPCKRIIRGQGKAILIIGDK